ncbi:hypothetical protein INT44_006587 [Umbelopsis vinacea]|uniref:UspA domain-containing protein n=1 Tax=Umbelopsis vinacea TaxID=44442 RepID=A0A8H7UHY0_9FUNG|nr:hypothetical protein INT44_006587 [Umbelopsis vinacea]
MRMVIAVDNSSSSRKAMSHGMAMADMMKDPPEVKIVYAIGLNPEQSKPIQFLDSLDRRNNMDIREDARGEVEQIQSWLNEFSKKHGNYEFVTIQRHEPVGQIITQFVYDMPADMLVIGSSSRSSVSGVVKSLLGSTCEYCIRHSPCAVTIVKQSDTKTSA